MQQFGHLEPGVKITQRGRQSGKTFANFTDVIEGDVTYTFCSDIDELILNFTKVKHQPDCYRLFIDKHEISLKAVL